EFVGQGDRVVFRVVERAAAEAVDALDGQRVRQFEGRGQGLGEVARFARLEQFVADLVFFAARLLPHGLDFAGAARGGCVGGRFGFSAGFGAGVGGRVGGAGRAAGGGR